MTEHFDIRHWELHHHVDGRRVRLTSDGCWLTLDWPDRPTSQVHLTPTALLPTLALAGEDPHAWDLVTEGWRLRLPDDGCDPVPAPGTGAEPIRHGGAIRTEGTWVLSANGGQVRHRHAGTVLWGWGVATIWTDDECGLSVIQGLPDGATWAEAGREKEVIRDLGLEDADITLH